MKIKPISMGLALSFVLVLCCNDLRAEVINSTFCQTEDCQSDLKQLEKMAKFGSGEAATILALAYATGEGVTQDIDLARLYLKQAVRWREPMAMHQMSLWMRKGFLFEKSSVQADEWLNKAVKAGFAPALTDKAKLLLAQDKKASDLEALELLEQASDEHYSPAQYLLAQLYVSGVAVETDIALAGLLFKELAIVDYKDSRQRLDEIITLLENITHRPDNEATPELSELLVELKQIENIEVIEVRGSKFNVNSELNSIVASLAAMRTYSKNMNTGSRIPGNLCGRGTGFCYKAFDRRANTPFAATTLGELINKN